MGSNVRLLWDHMGLSLLLAASAENADFPASNLETGNLRRFWRGTSTSEHTLTYDAGSGLTKNLDTVVLPYASLLVSVGANVALQRSDDMSAWTDVWTKTPLLTGDLASPDALHYVKEESAPLTRRGFRIRIYGTMTDVPSLGGGFFMGLRTELPVQPVYGRTLGVSRAYRGRDLTMGWPPMTPAQAESIALTVASVTPDQAEGMQETVAGLVYGGIPHWLYDPVGTVLSRASVLVPTLIPVLCMTPGAAVTAASTPTIEQPPEISWRERR